MNLNTIKYYKNDNIAFLELSTPPGNQMNMQFFEELSYICDKELRHEKFKGLIIKSKGRHFSSGANVEELVENINYGRDNVNNLINRNLKAFEIIYGLTKPKIALLKGICYGSGFELALTANYRIAQKSAILCLPEVSFDLMPGLGGISSLTYLIGGGRALEMILSGRAINAEEALELGVINNIYDKEHLEAKAIDIINNYDNFQDK